MLRVMSARVRAPHTVVTSPTAMYGSMIAMAASIAGPATPVKRCPDLRIRISVRTGAGERRAVKRRFRDLTRDHPVWLA